MLTFEYQVNLINIVHYSDIIVSMVASQISSFMIVYSIGYSGTDQRKHRSSVSLAFVRGIHRWPVNSPHKGPVTWKIFSFDDVIMVHPVAAQPDILVIMIHYTDVIMSRLASQITSLTVVYPIVYSDADQRKYQSSVSQAFVRGIHRGPVNSPYKWPVTRKMFPFDDVIMSWGNVGCQSATKPLLEPMLAYWQLDP